MPHVDPVQNRTGEDVAFDIAAEFINKAAEKGARRAGEPVVKALGGLLKFAGKDADVAAKKFIADNDEAMHWLALVLGPVIAGSVPVPEFIADYLPAPFRLTAEIALNAFLRNLPESVVEEVRKAQGGGAKAEKPAEVVVDEVRPAGSADTDPSTYEYHPVGCPHVAGNKDLPRIPFAQAMRQYRAAEVYAKRHKEPVEINLCSLWVDPEGQETESKMDEKMNFLGALKALLEQKELDAEELDAKAEGQKGAAKQRTKDLARTARRKAGDLKSMAPKLRAYHGWANFMKVRPVWTPEEIEAFLFLSPNERREEIAQAQPETEAQKLARLEHEKEEDEESVRNVLKALSLSDESAKGMSGSRTLFNVFGSNPCNH